jgi:hypothetical protein
MSFVVHIRSAETGEVRSFVDDAEWNEGPSFGWTEGNFGCDCNRGLQFFGSEFDFDSMDDDECDKLTPCGHSRYAVRVVSLAGEVLFQDERWPEAVS